MNINIDVTDWEEEIKKSNIELICIDDVVDAMQEMPMKPLQAARHLIINRELSKASDDVIAPNKLLLMSGAALDIQRKIERRKTNTLVNGHNYQVREFVATVTTSPYGAKTCGEEIYYESSVELEPKNATIVRHDDPIALNRAEHYLMTNVVGRIRERLLIIAGGHGEVVRVAERLKDAINNIVDEFKA